VAFALALVLAGALAYAVTPVLVVSAQDIAPESPAAAAGMVFGFAAALGALLYLGLGLLQSTIGIGPALAVAFLAPLPAAALAWPVLRRHRPVLDRSDPRALALACACGGAGPLGSAAEVVCAAATRKQCHCAQG
jgi:hypothetical protein